MKREHYNDINLQKKKAPKVSISSLFSSWLCFVFSCLTCNTVVSLYITKNFSILKTILDHINLLFEAFNYED